MIAKIRLVFSFSILFLSFSGTAQNNYWEQDSGRNAISERRYQELEARDGRFYSLNESRFTKELQGLSVSKNNQSIVQFPDENGKFTAFRVKEAPVLSEELSKKYPNIRSYVGYGLQNNNIRVRFSVSHKGIQSMMVGAGGNGNTFMHKIASGTYVAYNRDRGIQKDVDFICSTKGLVEKSLDNSSTAKPVDAKILRKYRLAVSASGEYTTHHGGTVADALAAINATVTRINEVFERDLAVRLELVANNDLIIFDDPETDPYGGNLNSEVQNTLTSTIGEANYDIGHLFHKANNGGDAGFIGRICVDNQKGSAYASGVSPEGDIFDLDFVSHEMGHQLGANHTWSFESEGTQVQAEPASGTTIMGYAGITGNNDVAPNGDDYLHYYSIVQITENLDAKGCGEVINITNEPPVVDAGNDFVIPKSTAFVLTGTATDADVTDVLTYTWEQIDDGVVTQATFGPTNPGGANFRSQRPSPSPSRYFPKLSRVLSGNLTQTVPPENSAWETVSDVEREMNFAFTVRDNAPGGGQVVSDLVNLQVVNSAGPFLMTSRDSGGTISAGGVEEITWDVANTDVAPVNAKMVDILLSIDGGQTFPIILAEGVANDGAHQVVMPGNPTTQARIMVKAKDNIFFAVNAADFTIEASEIVLDFSELEYEVCQPNDLVVTFDYETYLGFAEESTFSVIDTAPVELTYSFLPLTASANTTVTMTIANTGNITVGSYPIRVLATSASQSKEVLIQLNVRDANFSEVPLLSPVDGVIDVPTGQLLEWEENPLYTSYDLEVATDSNFNNIVETVTLNRNSYTASNLANQTTYYWRVKPKNICGEGVFGTPFSFTTIQFNCADKVATGLPLAISATGTPTVTSKIAFFEDLPLADLDVNLELDHDFLADLVVTLTSPSGTVVTLVSSSCGDLKNINATFDDAASSFVCGGDPAIEGTVKPLGALNSFNGESILGEWVLQISDNAASDGGMLKAFSLEVCVEGEFSPDEDGDGVFDADDICRGTPKGVEVDVSGCPIYRFPIDNFEISSESESCRSNNDGAIGIAAAMVLDYTVTVKGNGVDENGTFTDNYTLGNLAMGTYTVCVAGSDGPIDYQEFCFEVVVSEPEPLEVSSSTSLDGRQLILRLVGSELYNVELNGELIQTTEQRLTLDLQKGANALKVSTGLSCQGTYEEQFFLPGGLLAYPNPIRDFATIFIESGGMVTMALYTSNGQLIRTETREIEGSETIMDFTGLATGTYFLKVQGTAQKRTIKLIKQ